MIRVRVPPWAKELFFRFGRDDVFAYAAALAYNFLFALFPLLLFLSALLAFLHAPANLATLVRGPIAQLVPPSVISLVSGTWRGLVRTRHPTLLSLGALGFLWGMSGAFRQLIDALNHAYEFPFPRHRPFWRMYGLSLAAGLGVGLMIAIVLMLVVLGGPLLHTVAWLAFGARLGQAAIWIRWLAFVALAWFSLSILYAVLPDRPLPLRVVNPGTLVALAIWFAVSWLFSLYVERFNTYDRVYGGLGAVILLLLYLYFAGLAILVGAEINAMWDHGHWPGLRGGFRRDAGAPRSRRPPRRPPSPR